MLTTRASLVHNILLIRNIRSYALLLYLNTPFIVHVVKIWCQLRVLYFLIRLKMIENGAILSFFSLSPLNILGFSSTSMTHE